MEDEKEAHIKMAELVASAPTPLSKEEAEAREYGTLRSDHGKKKKGYNHTDQALHVIRKFGGPRQLSKYLSMIGVQKNPSSIYRWMKPKAQGGTGGQIPTSIWPALLKVARLAGVAITSDDLDPRPSHLRPTIIRGKNVIE